MTITSRTRINVSPRASARGLRLVLDRRDAGQNLPCLVTPDEITSAWPSTERVTGRPWRFGRAVVRCYGASAALRASVTLPVPTVYTEQVSAPAAVSFGNPPVLRALSRPFTYRASRLLNVAQVGGPAGGGQPAQLAGDDRLAVFGSGLNSGSVWQVTYQVEDPAQVFYAGGLFRAPPSGFAGQSAVVGVEQQGRVIDTLRFEGDESQDLPLPVALGDVQVLAASSFVREDSGPASAPVYAGAGRFVAPKPVTGVLVVSYPVRYRPITVYYATVPEDRLLFDTLSEGLSQPRDLGEFGPTTLVVVDGGEAATIDIDREIETTNALVRLVDNDSRNGPQDYRETSRSQRTVRITNPEDNQQYVDIERITEATFLDPNSGQQITLRFAE